MPDPEELALADFDQLADGTIRHRIRSLSAPEVRQLLEYERAHSNRMPVIEVLTSRLDQLAAGSTPSEGGEEPEQVEHAKGGSKAGPDTAAEPSRPHPHGVVGQAPKPDRT